jgi:hypothetical protein
MSRHDIHERTRTTREIEAALVRGLTGPRPHRTRRRPRVLISTRLLS